MMYDLTVTTEVNVITVYRYIVDVRYSHALK